jgi:ABC-type branched-subunit amino acid transport system substrate-binding protein
MRGIRRGASLAALAAVALAAAAVAAAEIRSESKADRPAGQAPPSFELRMGSVLAFSGALAGFGPSLDASARLAAEDANATLRQMGLARRMSIRWVGSEDDQTQVQPAVEAATKLVQIQKVNVIIGTILSASVIAVAQSVTIPNNVVLITPPASSPTISDLNDRNLVWRVSTSDTFQSRALVRGVAARHGRRARVNVGARNDAFGVALRDLFVDGWRRNGGRIGNVVTWNADAPSLDSEAQQLARGNPDAWVIVDLATGFQRLVPALVRAGGWDPSKTFVTNSMRNADLLKRIGERATDGLRGVTPVAPKGQIRTAFDEMFKRRAAGRPVTGFEPTSYDAVMLAFLAAVKGRSSSPNAIKANLRAVSGPPGRKYNYRQLRQAVRDLIAGRDIDYEGIWGPIDFDAKGDPSAGFIELWSFKDGSLHTVSTFRLESATPRRRR